MHEQLTETETCDRFITPAIERSGWDIHTQVRREYAFTDGRITVRGRVTHRGEASRADYLLYRGDIPLAVIEAKKHGLGPAHGIQQALRYAKQLDVPFAVSSDGTGFHVHDRTATAGEIERLVSMDDFPSPADLWERYRFWKGLADDRSTEIATHPYYEDPAERKEPRYYQQIAIQRVVEAVAKVDDLMALCDTLQASLTRAKACREQFATSISAAIEAPVPAN